MLPVVMGDFGEPLSHMAAVSFESRFALQSLRQAPPTKVVIRGGLAQSNRRLYRSMKVFGSPTRIAAEVANTV